MIKSSWINEKKRSVESRKWYRYQFFGKATIKVLKEKTVLDASIANISFSGIGLYLLTPIGKGKKVKLKISFIDNTGKIQKEMVEGKVDWQSKFGNTYLIGIIFDEELNTINQPKLVRHLMCLINTYDWPQPYKDKRISLL